MPPTLSTEEVFAGQLFKLTLKGVQVLEHGHDFLSCRVADTGFSTNLVKLTFGQVAHFLHLGVCAFRCAALGNLVPQNPHENFIVSPV